MKQAYNDVLKHVNIEPLWWDEAGVPRFEPFTPDLANNIYATQVVLMLIKCQSCQAPFEVCKTSDGFDSLHHFPLDELVKGKTIHYGDPPNFGCCPAGPTMNCEDVKILEFWERVRLEWKRRPELEIELL